MKTAPIHPADATVQPLSSAAWRQARQVFLAGNRLPERWSRGDPTSPALQPAEAGRAEVPQDAALTPPVDHLSTGPQRFVVLETGFGAGHRFLSTWQAWRDTPGPRTDLDFLAIEQRPFTATDLRQALAGDCPCPDLRDALVAQWPPLSHNLHTLSFEGGRVRLLLALGDTLAWLPELVARADAFFLTPFASGPDPALWPRQLPKALSRLAALGATAAAASAAPALRDHLRAAGFVCEPAPLTVEGTFARHDPRFTPQPSPRRAATPGPEVARHALVVGAGLAGCATACGLAAVGWRSTLLDAQTHPASGASGNPAGLFHGIVNGQDGVHARLYRTAALAIQDAVRHALAREGGCGQLQGLLRLEHRRSLPAMRALIDTLGLPAEQVQALDGAQASAFCGQPTPSGGWWFPGGGWVDPAALCRTYLARAGASTRFQGGARVDTIALEAGLWTARDAHGQVLGQAPVMVLTNAGDAMRLLGEPGWPVRPVRGQISWCDRPAQSRAIGWPENGPQVPVAGAGYWLPPRGSQRVFGATTQPGDLDPAVRLADHVHNLLQLARLRGVPLTEQAAQAQALRAGLEGRVGWRWNTEDKLPLWGALPRQDTAEGVDQVRQVPRMPGLFICAGLGARGITWSALAGQVLAALISDTPCPIESSLLDAVDPARFQLRSRVQRARHTSGR